MKTKFRLPLVPLALLVLSTLNSALSTAQAQGTAFTYQGQLNAGGAPVTGSYDFVFALYNNAQNGNQIGPSLTNSAVGVTNGLFNTTLDFGSGLFTGSNYWLDISVRTNDTGTFTELAPRQPITPAPYAIYSANAGSAATAATAGSANSVAAANIVGPVTLAQLPAAVVTNNENGASLTGVFSGDGGGLTNLQTTNLSGTIADSQLSTKIARLNVPNTNIQATGGVVITSGFITSAIVTNGGLGYTAAPNVTLSDVSGSNAVITATVSGGSVVRLAVQNAGSHYSAGATLTIAPPPSSAYQTFSSGNIFNGVNTFNNASNTFAGSFNGNGAGLTNLNLTGSSASSALGNVANGYQALASDTTGFNNTANGCQALENNTSGNGNTANGHDSLEYNTTGNYNTANGAAALINNTTGGDNTATGNGALDENTTGSQNTANGSGALYHNTTGWDNTAAGFIALGSDTTGSWNTANGNAALYNNTTGHDNTATGNGGLYQNTTGANNTANGSGALFYNTTGNNNTANGAYALNNNTTGTENTANGYQALNDNTTGNWNTANGNAALYNNTTGHDNTANGNGALNQNTTGGNNTASGSGALFNNTTGSNNISLGYQAGCYITTGSSNIDIGNLGVATDNNIIRIGTPGVQTKAFIAGQIIGDGSCLTNLNSANLSAGTANISIAGNAATATTAANVTGSIADAQLSANVAFLNGTNSFTGTNNFAGVTIAANANNIFHGSFTGSGAGLTNVSANAIVGGLTTNLAVLAPGGGTCTLCFTNGVLMAIQ